MAKYKVLKTYHDLELDKLMDPETDTEVEMTVKRADEINEKLKEKGIFLERIDNKKVNEEEKDEPEKSDS